MSSSDGTAPSSSSCCSDIRSSTSFVVGSNSSNVRIDAAAIAREIRDNTQHYTSDKLPPSWASYYHYADGTDLTAQYVFVLDAVNFCFWPLEGYEYDDLAGSLKSVLTSDPSAFSASKLAAVTEEIVNQWLQPTRDGTFWKSQHTLAVQRREAIANGTIAADSPCAAVPIPLLAARTRAIREIGSGLLKFFDGTAANLVRAAKGDVTRLVELITATFPAFRDSAVYRGRQIFLYKRAQILVGDLWGAFQGKGLGEFHNMHELTCFADYRVPQVLRASGILVYSPQLAADIDARKEMTPSELEIELRSATIQAVELMVKELKTHGVTLCPFQLDWLLWERGEANLDKLAPHHRVTTIFY